MKQLYIKPNTETLLGQLAEMILTSGTTINPGGSDPIGGGGSEDPGKFAPRLDNFWDEEE